jgi:aerobic C4-dicarboxylate transport protein
VVGIMLLLGVDRFMSTMRGLVSLSGQMMGSLVVSAWEKELDAPRALRIMRGHESPVIDPVLLVPAHADDTAQTSRPGDDTLSKRADSANSLRH